MNNKIKKRTIYTPNEIIDYGNYYEIILYNTKCKEIARTKIDKEDLQKVKNYKWGLEQRGYAKTTKIKLHQLILGKKKKYEIDHINHDTLDNRKQNLRHCTHHQNTMNKKNVKGITWFKRDKKWVAQIMFRYKHIHLGYFINKQDALKARKQAEIKYFGKFAYNN